MSAPSIPDAFRRAGITYRQFDHWVRKDWLRPYHEGGTGYGREWTRTEVAIGVMMKRLIDAGFSTAAAAVTAREAEQIRRIFGMSSDEEVTVDIGAPGSGLTLVIAPPATAGRTERRVA